MSIRKRHLKPFPVGQRVVSVSIGCKPSFEGLIEAHFGSYYHVLGPKDGTLWHRDGGELSAAIRGEHP